jgi:predicted HD superfamily hydrolase involved in NAD metabolism
MTVELERRLRAAVARLPEGLQAHIRRVEDEAVRLARLHDVDEERARLAALGHDLVRHETGPRLLELAAAYGLRPDEIETESPILVHGPVAAAMLLQDYGVEDADLVLGVDCHTTGRTGMTALENVLFVADKVEPHKLTRDVALSEVKEMAEHDLDAGVLRYLDHYLDEAVRRGWQVHPRSIEARMELIARFRREGIRGS